MTMPALFTERDLLRLKRHHWQWHKEGAAKLRWNFREGHWQMDGPQGEFVLPGGVDRETVNQAWDRFVAVANGQA
jgi:hypothetical protein